MRKRIRQEQSWQILGLCLWLLLVWAPSPAMGDEDDDNTVVVIGRRRETEQSRTTGQSRTIRPEDETRFDTITHLKRDSAILAPETGRISPSGFVVPRIRGQDVKLTDVYLEDSLLQDPYAGLPLIEDMDLRAFGSLDIHQGVPPPDMPGLNPIGTLRYRFREGMAPGVKLGAQLGQVFGSSQWGLATYQNKDADGEASTAARVYGRLHQTSGRYAFYSDEGTPYNTADDKIRHRENNDQRSQQLVPFVRYQLGPYTVQGLGWLYKAERGLASNSMVVPSATREQADGHLAHLRLGREWNSVALFHKVALGLNVTDTRDHRVTDDPGARFLAGAEHGDMMVASQRGGLNLMAGNDSLHLFAFYDLSHTSVRQYLGDALAGDLRRDAAMATLGASITPTAAWTLEIKLSERQHQDSLGARPVVLADEDRTASHHSRAQAAGGTLGFSPGLWGIYGQVAHAKRLPSLVEEFGNGSTIRPKSELRPESTRHRELGFSARNAAATWRTGLAAYEDQTEDKIVFVPAMANAVKADNARMTSIKGVDLRGELRIDDTSFYVSVSRLWPYDETRPEHKILPGIPEKVMVGELTQRWQQLTLRWFSRYRSEVYRDLANSVRLPGAWVHDASLDLKTSVKQCELQAGLAIRNVFNLMSVPISAPDTAENRGRTAYSDLAGAPLPGRQWLLSLSMSM